LVSTARISDLTAPPASYTGLFPPVSPGFTVTTVCMFLESPRRRPCQGVARACTSNYHVGCPTPSFSFRYSGRRVCLFFVCCGWRTTCNLNLPQRRDDPFGTNCCVGKGFVPNRVDAYRLEDCFRLASTLLLQSSGTAHGAFLSDQEGSSPRNINAFLLCYRPGDTTSFEAELCQGCTVHV